MNNTIKSYMWGYIIAGIVLLVGVFAVLRRRCKMRQNGLQERMAGKIIDAVPNRVFIVDRDFYIRKIYNPDAVEAASAVCISVGMNLRDYISPGDADTVLAKIRETFAGGKVSEAEYSVVCEGKKEYFEGRFSRVDADTVACFERDITERRKERAEIRQNEDLLNSILDNLTVPLIVKDINDDFKYIYWNRECEMQGGYTREEVLGKTDVEIYGEERGNYYRQVDMNLIARGGTFRNRETYVTPDGVKHVSIVNKNVISNDSHNWIMATRWDITDILKAQELLQEANRQMEVAFSVTSATPVVWELDTNRVCLKFQEFKVQNDGFFQEQVGQSYEDILRYMHPDDRERMDTLFKDLKMGRAENNHAEFRYDVTGKFDQFYDIYLAVETRNEAGIPTRIIGTMRNITRRKLYEQELIEAKQRVEKIQEINELILDHSNVGLVFLTPDYIVQWENLAKYSGHPLAGKYETGVCCYKNVRGMDAPCPGCVVTHALASGKRETKEAVIDADTIVELMATPVYEESSSDTIRGVVFRFADVTPQRKAAEELRQAKEAAEASDKLKSLFLSNMSHEIRTPLNAIVGFSELLTQTENPHEKEEYANIIARNNELLLQLINDILDLSKIEANTLEFVYTDVDINEMLRELELSNRRKATDNPELEITAVPGLDECVVYTERNRLHQVLSNLLGNAQKFTAKGYIRFGYEICEEGLRFFVSDTGKGIPEKQRGEIFKRFVKLDSFVNGTGLGLAICQTIIHKLGGQIGVDSEEGQGSTFWFTLPLKPGDFHSVEELAEKIQEENEVPLSCPIRKPVPADKREDSRPVLLIAEDIIDNYRLYQTLLGKEYILLHAWNGREAVEMYGQQHPDSILMDIKMPEMDGYEATALIRQQDTEIPIIAVSAYAFSEDVERIMSSGFSDYVSKPINGEVLKKKLRGEA